MLRSLVSKVMWVGRATVFLVGLAVILALLFGVASAALAGTGVNGVFNLGVKNTVDAMTQLVSNAGTGPAGPMFRVDNNSTAAGATGVQILTEAGKPPLKVNNDTRVTNLNADKLDGQTSSAFFSGKTYDLQSHPQGSNSFAVATGPTCDDGDVPVGGGYSNLSASEGSVIEDRAYTDTETGRHGWYVKMEVPSPGTLTPFDFFVYVRCADLGTPHQ